MNQLMNLMNLVKLFRVHYGFSKKNNVIFFLNGYKMPILGSLKFIRFINLATRSKKGQFVRQVTQINTYLMNLMNVYVVMIFKRIFEKVVLMNEELMKLECSVSTFRFINSEKPL
jgi:hypothetical protein